MSSTVFSVQNTHLQKIQPDILGFGIDTFVDFYEEIYATKTKFDWIDGLTGGGNIASLDINLEKNSLNVFNLPGVGEFNSKVYNFENISGSNTNDKLIGGM